MSIISLFLLCELKKRELNTGSTPRSRCQKWWWRGDIRKCMQHEVQMQEGKKGPPALPSPL